MNESPNPTILSTVADDLIAECYSEYLPGIVNYINSKIGNFAEASDIAQDAFVKLIENKLMLRKETVRSFIYTIVHNMVVDHIRHKYRKIEVSANMLEFSKNYQESVESQLYANDIMKLENRMLKLMPKQRRNIYILDRFEDKTADEIAMELKISKRTVESHLYSSRKIIREHIRKCV